MPDWKRCENGVTIVTAWDKAGPDCEFTTKATYEPHDGMLTLVKLQQKPLRLLPAPPEEEK